MAHISVFSFILKVDAMQWQATRIIIFIALSLIARELLPIALQFEDLIVKRSFRNIKKKKQGSIIINVQAVHLTP
jgi:hypothetical protein